jgi:hypothetical protein
LLKVKATQLIALVNIKILVIVYGVLPLFLVLGSVYLDWVNLYLWVEAVFVASLRILALIEC